MKKVSIEFIFLAKNNLMQKSREEIINILLGNIENTYKYTRGNL